MINIYIPGLAQCMYNLLKEITASTYLTNIILEHISTMTDTASRKQSSEHVHNIIKQAVTSDSHLIFQWEYCLYG